MIEKLTRWLSREPKRQDAVSAGFQSGDGQPMPVPSVEAEPERYEGRPLLILLENYVLDVLGEVDAGKQQSLREMTQKVFGGGEDWRETLRETLHLDSTTDESLLELWERNQQIAANANISLHPIQFAKMVADTNFVPLIEGRSQE